MSEQSSPIEPTAPTGEATFAADGAVTLEGVTFPPTESTPAPIDPTPETVAAAEVTPSAVEVTPDPYTPTKLESGEYELRLESGEVFRGKSELELASNIARSKMEATRYISELKGKIPQQAAPVAQPPQQEPVDPSTLAILDLIAPGFGVKDGAELIQGWKQMQERQSGFSEIAQAQRDNQTAVQFVQSTPDFVPTAANSQKLEDALTSMNLPFTVENARFAHFALKGQGLYEAAPVVTPPARTPTGQFAPRANPLPPNGPAPVSASNGAPSEADLMAMPLAELEAYMQSHMAQ